MELSGSIGKAASSFQAVLPSNLNRITPSISQILGFLLGVSQNEKEV